jgi:hypothetical protein
MLVQPILRFLTTVKQTPTEEVARKRLGFMANVATVNLMLA